MVDEIGILKLRAQKLAQAKTTPQQSSQEIFPILKFSYQNKIFAIPTLNVHEVKALSSITHVPNLPSYILGLIAIRGNIYSVNDLGKLLHIQEEFARKYNTIVVVTNQKLTIALAFEEIVGQENFRFDELYHHMEGLNIENKEYIQGVLEDGTIVLNIDNILNDSNIIIN